MTWYGVLKVVHLLSAVVWIGGGAAFAMIVARLVRTNDRATLNALLPQVTRYMHTVSGPGSGLVLLTGIAIVIVGGIGFGPLWVGLGFGGIIVLALFGGLVMRKRMAGLMQAVSATSAGDGALARAGARLRTANVVYLLIMASLVAVMMLKPTL